MKAQLSDKIQLISTLSADFEHHDQIVHQGMTGVIIECYDNLKFYAVDIAIPNPDLVGGSVYENAMLNSEQFIVISHASKK